MDEQVKQRLVGAIILALIGLVLIPWLFGDPKDPRATIHASFSGTPVPLQAGDAQSDIVLHKTPASAAPQAQPSATPRRLLLPASTPAPQTRTASSAAVASAKPRPTVAPAAQAWLLQLISYNNKKSADDFRARLRKDGLVAYREEVAIKGKSYFRVRLKVEGSKSQALELKQQLESKYRIQARLLPYKS